MNKVKQFSGVAALVVVLSVLAVLAVIDPFKHSPLHRGDDASVAATASEFPTETPAASPTPLGSPAVVTSQSRAYKFMATQPDSDEPITYDPCRPIPVVLNSRAAPDDGDRMVRESLDQVSLATGLQFAIEGNTSEAPSEEREPFQDRYGDRWAPVLIAWSDPEELPELDDDVAGIGGSSEVENLEGGKSAWVSGQVALDGPQLQEVIDDEGFPYAKAIVMHEIAHLVGLDHVDDETQIMNPYGSDVTEFQAGDLNGLDQLGRGTCFNAL